MSVFLFFCLSSRYDARHRKPVRYVYALNLGGTGISTPDNFSYRSNFRFRSRFRSRSNFRPRFSFSLVFVLLIVLVLVIQQAATYSIAVVAGN